MNPYWKQTGLCLLLGFVTVACSDQTANPDQPTTIRLARIGESFHQVSGAVVEEVLHDMGYKVAVIQGPHPDLYPRFGNGEADLFAGSWQPNGHGNYVADLRGHYQNLTALYDSARFYWAVPAYIPASQVSSLADLTRPEVLARMDRSIQGVTPGAGLTRVSRNVLQEYGLTAAGYSLREGNLPILIGHVDSAMREQRWFVTPLWQPQFLNRVYPFRILQDPRGTLGTTDQSFLLGAPDLDQRLPATTMAVLRRIHLSISEMTELDFRVNRQGQTPNQAARTWMNEHPDRVRTWREP